MNLRRFRLLSEVGTRLELGINVVGRISVVGQRNYELQWDGADPSRRYNGTINDEELTAAVRDERVNRIIVALDDRRGRLPVELLLLMKSRGVLVQDGIELYEKVTGKIPGRVAAPGYASVFHRVSSFSLSGDLQTHWFDGVVGHRVGS